MRVIVVDDEKLVNAMLVAWLSTQRDVKLVGTAFNGDDGLALCCQLKPDVAVLDIEMPGLDGLTLARKLTLSIPQTRVILLTSHFDPYCVYEASRIGVHAYVSKASSLEDLAMALRHAAKGERYYAPIYHSVRTTRLAQPDSFHKILTPKELAVLVLLTEGIGDEGIATRLDISPATVATHRRNLRRKTAAHNDRDLINYACDWGLTRMALS